MAKIFLWKNTEVQTFLPPVADGSTQWELNEYFTSTRKCGHCSQLQSPMPLVVRAMLVLQLLAQRFAVEKFPRMLYLGSKTVSREA